MSLIKFIEYVLNVLGERPSNDCTINRIDNNGHYEPGNLNWANPKEQIKNQRKKIKNFMYDQLKSENIELKLRIQQLEHAFMTKMLCKPAEI